MLVTERWKKVVMAGWLVVRNDEWRRWVGVACREVEEDY